MPQYVARFEGYDYEVIEEAEDVLFIKLTLDQEEKLFTTSSGSCT